MGEVSNQTSSIPGDAQVSVYMPGSVEKKRAVVMYLLIGLLGGINKKGLSEYEGFHLKQAMGRRMIFVLFVLLSWIMVFIPLIKYIPLLVFLWMVIILGLCIKQASDGKYWRKKENSLSIFAGIGEWLLWLFDIKPQPES